MQKTVSWRLVVALLCVLMVGVFATSCSPEEEVEAEPESEEVSVEVPVEAEDDGESEEDADADDGDEVAEAQSLEFRRAETDGFIFEWRIEGENIRLRLEAPTTGWIAVGFDPTRIMSDANMIIGYRNGDEQVLEDHYGNSIVTHVRDTQGGGTDDIIEYEVNEANGSTSFEALIPLDSGDSRDRPLVPGNEHRVIFAHGRNGADNTSALHSRHGALNLRL